MKEHELDYEKLEVYHAAVELVVLVDSLAEQLPRGRRYLADQLHRAVSSIVLNTAEGGGEFRAKEKARFYRMARRSTTETAAALDLCVALSLVEAEVVVRAKAITRRVASMLGRLMLRRSA